LDVYAKTDDGRTALQLAVGLKWTAGRNNIGYFEKGARRANLSGHVSTLAKRLETVKWLVEEGKADIDSMDMRGSAASDLGQSREFLDYLTRWKVGNSAQ
jgi:hypothetical protein